ncbi:MAG: hypothetical protein N4A37_00585 [Prolixibacteraceae bacterium]|jgi:hypothetical protein|nr:hypothetical protein [Prolixibacteraceae bacterium]
MIENNNDSSLDSGEKRKGIDILKRLEYELPIIREEPNPLKKSKWFNGVIHADEEKLILKYKGAYFWMTLSSIFLIASVCLICSGFNSGFYKKAYEYYTIRHTFYSGDLMAFWGVLSMLILGALPFLIYFVTPKKYWVFNRKTGIVTVPGKYFVKGHDMPFDQIRLEIRSSANSRFRVVMVPLKNALLRFTSSNWVFLEEMDNGVLNYKSWSFYTWYMDRNRPLPPGEVFDHCREREFQQRKDKGFPYPEHFSFIPTLEANPTFQVERDKVWSDDLFSADVYKFGKVDFRREIFPEGSFKATDKYVAYTGTSKTEEENHYWHEEEFEHKNNFKLASDIIYVRFIFENGEVVYSPIDSSKKYLVPPREGLRYEKEFIYHHYIPTDSYYKKIWKQQEEYC